MENVNWFNEDVDSEAILESVADEKDHAKTAMATAIEHLIKFQTQYSMKQTKSWVQSIENSMNNLHNIKNGKNREWNNRGLQEYIHSDSFLDEVYEKGVEKAKDKLPENLHKLIPETRYENPEGDYFTIESVMNPSRNASFMKRHLYPGAYATKAIDEFIDEYVNTGKYD